MYIDTESFKDLKTISAVSMSISSLMVDQPNPLVSGSEGISYQLLVTILGALFCNLCSLSRVVVPQHPHTGIQYLK